MDSRPIRPARPVEQLALQAVVPETLVELDGWILRHDSISRIRRRNSVLALTHNGELPLDQKTRAVEDFYGHRGLPARFQLSEFSQPSDLVNRLQKRGYEPEAPTWVMTKRLDELTPRVPKHAVTLNPAPSHDWAAVASSVTWYFSPQRITHSDIRYSYASLAEDGSLLAIGMGILQDEWLGIFGMGTIPLARNRGFGSSVICALCQWALSHGTRHAYLQVEDSNHPAENLYFKHGFDRAYSYSYWTLHRPQPHLQ